MNSPKLDGRTVSDVLTLIEEKSRAYTPEWKFNANDPDGGTALAMLFSEMFCGTVDRLDRFPDKCSLEFLNLIGVSAKPAAPALGVAAAQLASGTPDRVYISKGTQLFTDRGGDRLIFETTQGFFATPGVITDIYMTDPARDVITHTALPEELPVRLLRPDPDRNIECHRFSVACGSVLRLIGAAEIRLTIGGTASAEKKIIEMLCSSESAAWTMPTANGNIHLAACPGEGCVILMKPDGVCISTDERGLPDEDGTYRVFCEMRRTNSTEPLAADSIKLSCNSVDEPETMRGRRPDCMFCNDTELPRHDGVYPFDKEPNAYDSLYICSDEVFSKAGAQITLDLSVGTVTAGAEDISAEPDFAQKLLVDKGDLKTTHPDDIYISDVIWEYWNGLGWARLEVSGDINPFSCMGQDGRRRVVFICPDDIRVSVQSARSGLWIRARIREIRNRFSMNARWLIPFLRTIDLRFDHGSRLVEADSVTTLNSCTGRSYAMNGTRTRMELFATMPDQKRTAYFRFDKPPCGFPVNLFLGFDGETDEERDLEFSYRSKKNPGSWSGLRTADHTGGFCSSGIISMYIPDDFAETELFGISGYWIRAEEHYGNENVNYPSLCMLQMNAVDIMQQVSVSGERSSVRAGIRNQTVQLLNTPVTDCALWVSELSETPLSELQELYRAERENVRTVSGDDGLPAEWWVRWQRVESLASCGPEDRCYELDCTTGRITFGDGVNGRIPAYSAEIQVSADYSWGGGVSGNLPAGAIDGLMTGIPFVESMTNIIPTCGGTNAQSLDAIRRIGAQRIRHGGRAVTLRDHEGLIAEEFAEVGEVRCFSGIDRRGTAQAGCITAVVKPTQMGSTAYALSLCRRIENFLLERECCEPISGGRLAVIPARLIKVSAEISIVVKDIEKAAQTERDVISAVSRLTDTAASHIGVVPCENDIYAAVRGVANVAYAARVLLTGEYFSDGISLAIPLDRKPEYPFFLPVTGTHTVRIDGVSGM